MSRENDISGYLKSLRNGTAASASVLYSASIFGTNFASELPELAGTFLALTFGYAGLRTLVAGAMGMVDR